MNLFNRFVLLMNNSLQRAAASVNLQPTMNSFTTESTKKSVKKADIMLAATIAVNGSIRTVDSIGEVIKDHAAPNSVWAESRIHYTKCSMIIKNELGESMREEIKESMKGQKFSLLVDESTDVSSTKLMAVCVCYFNSDLKKVVYQFLGQEEVVSCSGENLFLAIKKILDSYDLNFKDVVGYSSDGANNVAGQHNSVWSRVKEAAPDAVQLKCTCHSLALCVEHAFEEIPGNISVMLADVPAHFCRSSIRRESYLDLYKVMNDDKPESNVFTKFCATCWLAKGKVLYNIITQWSVLTAYFDVMEQGASSKDRYRFRELKMMLKDDANLLYFTFLTPLVQEMESLNSKFQTAEPNMNELMMLLDLHYKSLRDRVYETDGRQLHVLRCEYGARFEERAISMDQGMAV